MTNIIRNLTGADITAVVEAAWAITKNAYADVAPEVVELSEKASAIVEVAKAIPSVFAFVQGIGYFGGLSQLGISFEEAVEAYDQNYLVFEKSGQEAIKWLCTSKWQYVFLLETLSTSEKAPYQYLCNHERVVTVDNGYLIYTKGM